MRTDKKVWRNRKARKELARRLQSENPGLEVVHPHAAGIDVGTGVVGARLAVTEAGPHRGEDSNSTCDCLAAEECDARSGAPEKILVLCVHDPAGHSGPR